MRFFGPILLLLILFTACDEIFDPCTEGNGNIITTQLEISPFQSISHEGSWDVQIIYDSIQSVIVTGDENIIERIELDTDDGEWEIEMRDGCYRAFQLDMEIRTPLLSDINLDGSGDIYLDSINVVQLRNSGAGNIVISSIHNDIGELFLINSGSGDIMASTDFEMPKCSINSSGSGDLQLFQIESDSAFITLSGSGDSEITVNEYLQCTLSGSGDISYKGFPVINEDITGSGRLIDAN